MLYGKDAKTGETLTDDAITNNLITFLIAGHETTSGLLSFVFYYLLKNPSAYQKAQQEVDEVIGTGPITIDHLSKIPYINAILRETLRLTPTAPLFAVQALKDEVIGGKYSVKKGEPLALILPKVHRDPLVWGNDADEWKPERMYDENFNRIQKEFPNSWKPFGNGMRACIGRPFAWLVIRSHFINEITHWQIGKKLCWSPLFSCRNLILLYLIRLTRCNTNRP
jgi:cytochrome P450 / NADPH-cytochrome P450 reductase